MALPLRLAGSFIVWAFGCAAVMVVDTSITQGHPPSTWLVAAPVMALGVGATAGTIFWRASKSRPLYAAAVLVLAGAAFATAAVVGGTALNG